MYRKIDRIESHESSDITMLTDRLNRSLKGVSHRETDLKFDVNKKTGNYYYVITIYK